MKTEKIILSFIAVIVGLLVAGLSFYLYQSAKTPPSEKAKTITIAPVPSPKAQEAIVIDSPTDEDVVSTKAISVKGKTFPNATVTISTGASDFIADADSNGSFSQSITLIDGENQLIITALSPDGSQARKIITVNYTTESF